MGVRVGQLFRMQLLRHSLVMALLVVGVSYSAPFNPVGRVINAQTGEDIAIDKDNLDINGFLSGPLEKEFVSMQTLLLTDRAESPSGRTWVLAPPAPTAMLDRSARQENPSIPPQKHTRNRLQLTRDGPSSKSRTRRDSLELPKANRQQVLLSFFSAFTSQCFYTWRTCMYNVHGVLGTVVF